MAILLNLVREFFKVLFEWKVLTITDSGAEKLFGLDLSRLLLSICLSVSLLVGIIEGLISVILSIA